MKKIFALWTDDEFNSYFPVFESEVKAKRPGSKVVNCSHKSDPFHYILTFNKVKTEIKPYGFTVGFGLKDENLAFAKEKILKMGFKLNPNRKSKQCFTVFFKEGTSKSNVLADFFAIVSAIEEVTEIIVTGGRLNNCNFQKPATYADEIPYIIKRYKNALHDGDANALRNHRYMLSADIYNNAMTKYFSDVNATYREHAIPVILVHNEFSNLVKDGVDDSTLTKFLLDSMVIVLITTAQQKKLDHELSLRTAMPEGWKWGDDPLARLHAAGIEFVQY